MSAKKILTFEDSEIIVLLKDFQRRVTNRKAV